MPTKRVNIMARISSDILGTEGCRSARERIVTRMGEDRLRASFASANRAVRRRRIAQHLPLRMLHQIESITRDRFIIVVGPQI